MINPKGGAAHSMLQTQIVGNAKLNEAVIAGMICSKNSSGDIIKGGTATSLFGLAALDQTHHSVRESGKLALYALDGASILETDQTAATITTGNYGIGALLYAQTGNTGLITTDTTVAKVIGQVEGIRNLPYVDASGAVKVNSTKPFLGIKLAA